jgi:flagellar assembly factor FliW
MNPSPVSIGHNSIGHNGATSTEPIAEDPVQTESQHIPSGRPVEVSLEHGLPGLSTATAWTLGPLEVPSGDESAFQLLSPVDESELSVIVADPWVFFEDYAPDLPDNELEALGIESVADALVVCVVTLDAEEGCFYLNLLGPVVFHGATGVGRQVVLSDQDWPVRARVDVIA